MNKYSGLLSTLGLCLALSFGAAAQDEDVDEGGDAAAENGADGNGGGGLSELGRRFYVAPMFSYSYVEDDRNTEDGLGGTMSIGKRVTSGMTLELTATYNSLESKAADDASVELMGVGIGAQLFVLRAVPGLYGLLALHQGQVNNHPTTPAVVNGSTRFDYRTTLADFGVGFLHPITKFLGMEMYLRTEARYRVDAHNKRFVGMNGDKHFYDGVFNIGLQIPLGEVPSYGPPSEEVSVVETGAAGDSDGDGVMDDTDACPDTPGGDGRGCAADSDGDGVPDDKDQCPDTPAGEQVDESGCPVQGQAQGQAQGPGAAGGAATGGCRAPAPGEPISLEGCATGDAIVLRGVTFEFNSSRLTANAKVILNQVADALNARTDIRVEIGGHTDSLGSDQYNQKLSHRRARTVNDYLVARGITPERMSIQGYGETVPVDSNETEEGREINRRVEMKILEGGQQPQ